MLAMSALTTRAAGSMLLRCARATCPVSPRSGGRPAACSLAPPSSNLDRLDPSSWQPAMPSLLHKLQHKHHHHSSSSSSASSSGSSPKLETLSLSPSTSAAPSAAAPSSSSTSTASSSTGLKSILRSPTVSSVGSSSVDNELADGERSGASTPRTSVIGSGSSPAASINGAGKTRSLNSDYEVEESLGCRSIKVQGQSCCYAIV